MRKSKHSTWLLSWCSDGIEAIINVDEYQSRQLDQDKQAMWDTLAAPDPENVKKGVTAANELNRLMHSILLRARVNPQRHYEVYTIGMPTGTTEQDIRDMFEDGAAQYMVDLIREKGTKYFSDRANPQKVRIV
jgi:hypothetical protein